MRVLLREGSCVPKLETEIVRGDLRDAASVERAVAGCGLVFHVAADYRLWAKDPRELYRSNVDGDAQYADGRAGCRCGAGRLYEYGGLYRRARGRHRRREPAVSLDEMAGDYKRSKFMAEQVALEFARGGFPV